MDHKNENITNTVPLLIHTHTQNSTAYHELSSYVKLMYYASKTALG